MQKNLIALAIGAAIAAAPVVATQADVKLFGKLEVELVNLDGGKYDNLVEQGDAGGMSRFGIDASKDLGNGLKAIGRYAFKMNPSNGSSGGIAGARDQYVGLAGGFGAVVFGRMPTPYKMYGGVKWDPYLATFMEARASGGMSGGALGHQSFVNDVLAYASPKLGPVKFTLAYVADKAGAGYDEAAGTPNDGALDGTFTSGITGTFGPVEVIGAYTKAKPRNADSISQGKLGVRYKGNGLTAALQYEDVDSVGAIKVNGHSVGAVGSGSVLFANLGYKFGNTLIAGNYGNVDADNTAAGTPGQDVDYWALGARYFFAKKVSAYLGYAETKTDTKYKMLGTGLRYDF